MTRFTATLAVRDVTVTYPQATALDRVCLDIGPGVTGLLGHNGAGKSTLINVLCGVTHPTQGSVAIAGRAESGITSTAYRQGPGLPRELLGLLPQKVGFFPKFTAYEFVEYAAWLHEMPSSKVGTAVEDALRLVDLWDRKDTAMRHLSGGMVQRAGIAAALVHSPRVLLLDEPSNGLDIEQRQIFREIVRRLDPATITILSSHLAEDLAVLCDQVVILQQGRVAYSGPVSDLCEVDEPSQVTGPVLEDAFLAVLRR